MNQSAKSRELHAVLDAANKAARLNQLVRATGCDRAEVTSEDGKTLDPFKILDTMRAHGYQVGQPCIPKTQTKPGYTAWKVSIVVQGVAASLVFFTPGVTS
jgi:hypothetical protein